MKLLEASRREVLRDFMIAATGAIQNSWGKLPELCAFALESAKAVDATSGEVERDVSARALAASEEKVHSVFGYVSCFCCCMSYVFFSWCTWYLSGVIYCVI